VLHINFLAAYLSNFLTINFDSDHHITTTLNYDDGIGEMMCLTNAEDHNIPPITLNYDDGIVSTTFNDFDCLIG
jgi:hypothetical protein